MDRHLRALESSAGRLHGLVAPLGDEDLAAPAYPAAWSIADVLSHLGSGAVIQQRRFDDTLAGQSMPDDFAPNVWAAWNAKPVRAKCVDALLADRSLIERFHSSTESEQERFQMHLGPLAFDFAGFVGLRLNEHTLHTWDVETALHPAAVLPDESAELIIDQLELVARYTAKPIGVTRAIVVSTVVPVRRFTVDLASDSVTFTPGASEGEPDLTMPAEALIRLVYGRLDPEHTPADVEGDRDRLADLRRVFPGP